MSDTVARRITLRVEVELLDHEGRDRIWEMQRKLEQKLDVDFGDPELEALKDGVTKVLSAGLRDGSARVGAVTVLDPGETPLGAKSDGDVPSSGYDTDAARDAVRRLLNLDI